ncbi:hypothetical protein P4479_23215 [Brevibacillus agri]|uniref:hypothetical protein n=1 Tax=Brevibacillus agri TaxID=51101 RepID=UPI002E1CE3CA|nr:hypothetical protein [Brevibacillus agri]
MHLTAGNAPLHEEGRLLAARRVPVGCSLCARRLLAVCPSAARCVPVVCSPYAHSMLAATG